MKNEETEVNTMRSCSIPRRRVQKEIVGPSATKQSFKEECDINNIMKHYQNTGVLEHVNRQQPRFGFVPALDLQEALTLVSEADEAFAGLSAEVRKRFENDPVELLKFVGDEGNREEAEELGLVPSRAIDQDVSPVQSPVGDESQEGRQSVGLGGEEGS